MYIIINLLIFVVIFFLYIHIKSFTKISNDIDVYVLNNPCHEIIEENSRFNQPLHIKNIDSDILNINYEWLYDNYKYYDINYRNINDDDCQKITNLNNASSIFNNDISNLYISKNNYDFIKSTFLNEYIKKLDIILRSNMLVSSEYDIITGSKDSYTKLEYSLISKNYIIPTSGSIEIFLYPPKYSKYMHINKDYFNMEFTSNIDIYNISDKYKDDFNKCKAIKVILNKGDILLIPMFWIYSIKLLEKNTLVYNLKYKSFINYIVNTKDDFIHLLQKYNKKINQKENKINLE
jgi:hypothetical protein